MALVGAGEGLDIAERPAAGQEFQPAAPHRAQRRLQMGPGHEGMRVGRLLPQTGGGVALRVEVDQQGP